MTGLMMLAAMQLALIVCLVFLVSRFIGMVRSGAPLVQLRRPHSVQQRVEQVEQTKQVEQPAAMAAPERRSVTFKLPLPRKNARPDKATADAPTAEQAELEVRGRTRKLLTLSELEAASNRAAARFPENYYAEIEARLEDLFQSFIDKDITLGEYLEAVRKERALAQAVLRNAMVLVNPDLRQEAENAAAAIDWCLDWASGQLRQNAGDLAA